MSPPEFSGENPLNTSDDKTWKERASLASNTDIRIRLKETLKELALFQSKVAVLEAEKLLHPPQDYSTPTSAIKDSSCRLYLPEMEPKDINNACSGMNSEYAEINISIFDAVNSGDTESLCDILLYNPRCIFSVNQEGRTALHLACMNNSHVIALLLIQHGALLNAPDAAGQTSMHLCSDPGMIHLLCQKGARTDIRDNHSFTPLYVHTLHCREELVQMLLSHNADPTLLDPLNLRNTLHCAAYMGNYNIISMLLSVPKINTFLDAQDIYGNTAIHIIVSNRLESLNSVCRNNSTHKVQSLLIQKCLMLLLNRGANVNIKNKFDETCLHFICSNIHLRETYSTAPILEIVVNMGGEVNVSDRDGCTPLMVGAVYGNWEVCELLVRGGGDLNSLFSITTSYLLNNRKEYYENNKKDRKSRSKDSKINYGDMGDNTDNNDNDDENLLYKTCVTSEIIPRQTLLSLYNHISAPQSMIKNNNFNERRCMGCREGFDSGAVNDKNSSFLSAFLGLEIEAQLTVGLKNCRPSGYNYYDKKKTGHGNNCGHCGRYLCPKCLNHELLVALLPEFLQTSILKSQGLRLSFLTHSGDNLKLCQLCYTILAVK